MAKKDAGPRRLADAVVGQKIVAIKPVTPELYRGMGWDGPRFGENTTSIVLVLEDGTWLVPLRDDEGNGPGSLRVMYCHGGDELMLVKRSA